MHTASSISVCVVMACVYISDVLCVYFAILFRSYIHVRVSIFCASACLFVFVCVNIPMFDTHMCVPIPHLQPGSQICVTARPLALSAAERKSALKLRTGISDDKYCSTMRGYIGVADLKRIPDRALQMAMAKIPTPMPGIVASPGSSPHTAMYEGSDDSVDGGDVGCSQPQVPVRIGQFLGQLQLQHVAREVLSRVRVHTDEHGLRYACTTLVCRHASFFFFQ